MLGVVDSDGSIALGDNGVSARSLSSVIRRAPAHSLRFLGLRVQTCFIAGRGIRGHAIRHHEVQYDGSPGDVLSTEQRSFFIDAVQQGPDDERNAHCFGDNAAGKRQTDESFHRLGVREMDTAGSVCRLLAKVAQHHPAD